MYKYRVKYKYIDCIVMAKSKAEARALAAQYYKLMPSEAPGLTCERIDDDKIC